MRDLDLLNLSEEPRYDSAALFWLAVVLFVAGVTALAYPVWDAVGFWTPFAVREVA